MKAPYRLSLALAAVMIVQPLLGLLLREQYRDVAWIRATWFGNDAVTLFVAAPLFLVALVRARRGAVRARLVWLGLLGYGAYNYAYYLFGAVLNTFFPLYVAALVLAVSSLVLALADLDVAAVAARFRPKTPARLVGGYFVVVAAGLALVWFGTWAAYAFANRAPPIEPEAFKLVAALDTTLMVPALAIGGVLLWRRRAWGYVVAAIAGVQGALYLLVLAVNAVVAILRGLAAPPGELPIWGTLAAATLAATALLLAHAHDEPR